MLSLSDWITTLTLVFGGCCSNAITTEWLTSDNPHSGILITFLQFLVVSLYALPTQLVFSSSWIPRLRTRRVPLLPYLAQVALFFALSVLNNAAFAYDIPMTVHIVFRSGGMIINMILGWLLVRKQYTLTQVLSVTIVTIGIILTTLSASNPTPTAHDPSDGPPSLYTQGITILALALLLSGFLGLSQDVVYARYIAQSKSTPDDSQPSWQESMFYNHVLALPLFTVARAHIVTELGRSCASPLSLSLASAPQLVMPRTLVYLVVNTVTQLLCVVGVNRLTGRVSSLTVTLILTVRKAVSLLLSVAVYGRQANAVMWTGAALVFMGTIGYSTGTRPRSKDKKD
ncbi:UAA transporter [Boletus reticuloceps]|uniref:UAA transporter n=1 Tax=Boletus reticuloceps TaxID=495285 RepID=A0A8I2YN45_9AGAM|nr:UAA transporter [Boletus reticuloceps]